MKPGLSSPSVCLWCNEPAVLKTPNQQNQFEWMWTCSTTRSWTSWGVTTTLLTPDTRRVCSSITRTESQRCRSQWAPVWRSWSLMTSRGQPLISLRRVLRISASATPPPLTLWHTPPCSLATSSGSPVSVPALGLMSLMTSLKWRQSLQRIQVTVSRSWVRWVEVTLEVTSTPGPLLTSAVATRCRPGSPVTTPADSRDPRVLTGAKRGQVRVTRARAGPRGLGRSPQPGPS